MKAIRIHAHGGPEVLRVDDIAEPQVQKSQVKIKIAYSALNHMDLWVRKGIPGMGALPLVLGCDASGVIEEVGEGVSHLSQGDRVYIFPMTGVKNGEVNLNPHFKIYGEHQNGLHSESVVVPAENALPLDESISFDQGAAFPLVGLTAYHMVCTKGQLRKNETVLVMGASSGVGSMAVQMAKALGARVIATAGSTEKKEAVTKLGADHVIDHYKDDISVRVREITEKKGVDLIIEHVGEKVWKSCLKSLGWGGRLVTCGATTGPMVQMDLRHIFIKQQSILGSTMGTPEEMLKVHQWVVSKDVTPVVDRVFAYNDIQEAHRYLESSKNVGKVLLKWT